MGIFDRIKKAFSGSAPPSRESSEPPPPADDGPAAVVPEGHKILFYRAPIEPGLQRTPGGLLIASLGAAGDEPDRELDQLLRDVEAALREPSSPARLVNADGPLHVSDLFAPSRPPVLEFPSPIQWVFHRGCADVTAADPRRLQALLRRLHKISAMQPPSIPQSAYIADNPSPTTLQLARLLRDLGLEVRQPEDKTGPILVEVHRPEGHVLCALAGPPYPSTAGIADGYVRRVNQEKDRAEAEDDEALLSRLDEEERAYLAKHLAGAADAAAARPPFRSPRLCRLLLEVHSTASDGAMQSVFAELLQREAPLLLMANPHGGGIAMRSFGEVEALPAYPDVLCLEWAAEDLRLPPDSLQIAGIPPRDVFSMAAQGGVGVALNAFRDRATPVYVILPPDAVRSLAQGIAPRSPTLNAIDLSGGKGNGKGNGKA